MPCLAGRGFGRYSSLSQSGAFTRASFFCVRFFARLVMHNSFTSERSRLQALLVEGMRMIARVAPLRVTAGTHHVCWLYKVAHWQPRSCDGLHYSIKNREIGEKVGHVRLKTITTQLQKKPRNVLAGKLLRNFLLRGTNLSSADGLSTGPREISLIVVDLD